MDLAQVRVELDGLLVCGDGLLQLILLLIGETQVVVGFSVVGVELNGCLELGDGLIELILVEILYSHV